METVLVLTYSHTEAHTYGCRRGATEGCVWVQRGGRVGQAKIEICPQGELPQESETWLVNPPSPQVLQSPAHVAVDLSAKKTGECARPGCHFVSSELPVQTSPAYRWPRRSGVEARR